MAYDPWPPVRMRDDAERELDLAAIWVYPFSTLRCRPFDRGADRWRPRDRNGLGRLGNPLVIWFGFPLNAAETVRFLAAL